MQIQTDQFQKEMKEHGNYNFPLLVSEERLSQYESGSFLWHWHPEIELTLVTKGRMLYKINNRTFSLDEGYALFGNSGTLHTGSMQNAKDCEYFSITFEPKLIYGYDNSIIYLKYVKPVIQNPFLPAVHFDLSENWHHDVIALIREMIELESKHEITYELDMISRLDQFWKLLFLNADRLPSETPYDKNAYQRIRSIISYIEKNYDSDLTLEEIADSIHVCRSECSKLFKRFMNISLFEFITQYRIEKGAQYLINTDYPIIEIAALTGFNDSNYFSKVFRKQKGCSPSQYRRVNCPSLCKP